ncbi:hypothetical protein F3J19_21835 [Burkholderia sp. Ax-1724]|nr:hypothetical protein [Burkholderia sp. Ax-1724]
MTAVLRYLPAGWLTRCRSDMRGRALPFGILMKILQTIANMFFNRAHPVAMWRRLVRHITQ